ncbi:leucine-rich repeat domain-containing protein [Prevotella lacticifex]|uniref:leucine-rich repeat domain-containing protein n=1 Tax=Prevotella lacticifex TaxID=2854755 RepID=UPI001CC8295F|nr:leucine-rich repeat domain-containing protein [Prevotella lacticifex]
MSKIGGTDLAKYTASTDIDLAAAYPNGTFTVDGTTYTITSMAAMGGTSIATVKMPSTVTSLPKYCFNGCTSLTTVSIPGIQTIGEAAFSDCTSLSGELTIPKGASVAYRAFDGCSGITSIVLHSSMTSGADWSGNGCFMSMSGVKSVSIIDDGNNTIPANVFGHASFSKDGVTLKIDNTITGIGAFAFSGANFPKTLTLSQFTSFGKYAFANNKTLANKDVPFAENTQFTGEQTFLNCTGLSGTLTIPNGANISYRAFDGCKGITSIVLHSGMTSREYNRNGCFMTMSGVTSVSIKDDGNHTIPANVFGHASFSTDGVSLNIDNTITGIGDYAFYNANFPTTLDLSSQFTSYGVSAFEDNKAFQGNDQKVIAVKPSGASSVTVGSKAFWNTQATEIDIYPNVSYSGCGPTDAYYSNGAGPYNGTNIKTIKFTDGVTSVPDYVFLHASDIPSTCTVTWPSDPTYVGKGAFCGVQFTAAIPSKMSGEGTIGEYAYARNNMSGEITIPTGCIKIGSNALYDCDKITKITVPKSTTSIGDFAFSGCAALASVELPTLTSGDPQLTLGGGFIANDPKLTAFTITNAVKTIYCCSNGNTNNASFSSLTTPFTVTLASDKVKAETENRTGGTFFTFEKDGTAENPNTLTIQVTNGVTSIPDELFSENESGIYLASNIDKIVLSGKDVTSIGKKSFNHIRTLLSVDMSGAQNIASIGESAFADCAKLTTVTFGESSNITTVGASAFSGCSSLTSVDFGGAKKLQTLGESAFNNCSSLANINQTSDGKNDLRGSTLTSIGLYTFGGCTALANLYLPSTLMRINAAAFVNSGGDAAGLVTKDAAYIETSAGHCFNTFCRGFDVNVSKDMNTTVNTSNTATVWAVTGINTSARQAILQQVTESAPSSESYLNGYIIYNSVNDSTSATDRYKTTADKLNLHLMFDNDSHNVIKNANSTTNDDMMKGVIDAKTFSDADEASRCYVIWGKDQKLHHIKQNTTLAAGKAYIDPGKSGSGAKFDGFSFFFSSEPFTPTAINAVKANADSHSAAHDNDDSYYDLQGRKVDFPSTGIYIHHGRKVVITHKPQSLNL